MTATTLPYALAPVTLSSDEFDAARLALLRRRVMVFAYITGLLLIAVGIVTQVMLRTANRPMRIAGIGPALGGIALIIASTVKLRTKRHTMSLRTLVIRTSMIVVMAMLVQLPASKLIADAIEEMMRSAGLKHAQVGALAPLFISMLCLHFAGSLVIPWSLWESARPVLIIVGLAVTMSPFAPDSWPERIGGILGLALMGAPGMLVCWFRYSRFRNAVALRFFSDRYTDVQRELATARRIHEMLFPRPIHAGPVLFDYRYEPMRQIGGDFVDVLLHARDGSITVVLVDVTGHGIAAALAVNRLHGEIKRTLAMQKDDVAPLALPGSVISALNDYIHLTFADESVFATALAVTVDPNQKKIAWANAGHPPAFLRRTDGSIEQLDSTVMMLGPLPREAFDADPQVRDFAAGDELIAYTDGAIECRDASDNELGIAGLRRVVESSGFRSPDAQPAISTTLDAMMSHIARFRSGQVEDDTLVLAVKLGQETR